MPPKSSTTGRLSQRFEQALVYAARLHAGQRRKGSNVPYLAHLLAVSAIVLENGGNEDEAIAALLHDAAEDQGGEATLQEIHRRFGPQVAAIVDGCSDTMESPKPAWQRRKQAYLHHLPSASASVRLVSAADKLHNACSILRDYRQLGSAVWMRFRGGKEGTLWYYRALVQTYRSVADSPLIEELDRVVSELEEISNDGRPVLESPLDERHG